MNFVKGVIADYQRLLVHLEQRKISVEAAEARRESLDAKTKVLCELYRFMNQLLECQYELKDLIAKRRSEARVFFSSDSLPNEDRQQ